MDYIEKVRSFLSSKRFFIQIGAYDGIRNDPVHKYVKDYRWEGILVEPDSYSMPKLKETYKDQNLIFEQIAISDTRGEKLFYIFEGKRFGSTLDFDRADQHIIRDSKSVIKTRVECITFSDLISKYHICDLEVLVIDTEGHDFRIIKLIDFSRIKPHIIIYERTHIKDEVCRRFLESKGYTIVQNFSQYDNAAILI